MVCNYCISFLQTRLSCIGRTCTVMGIPRVLYDQVVDYWRIRDVISDYIYQLSLVNNSNDDDDDDDDDDALG